MLRLQLLFILLFVASTNFLYAQTTNTTTDSTNSPFYQPTLDELTQIKRKNQTEATVSVAGFQSTTLRESPGIVTLITSEEIQNQGAKDLSDVLRNVPGFDLAFDVFPVNTIRGNSASEAKLLLLIDGHQMNDIAIGASDLFMRYPLSNIDRIEIIRGAGSAQYGGMAGLAVINIITKKAKNNFEGGASSVIGVADGGIMRRNFEGWVLTKLNNNVEIDLSAASIEGKWTNVNDRINGLYFGPVNNRDTEHASSSYWNFGLRYKKIELRYLNANSYSRLTLLGMAKILNVNHFLSAAYRIDINAKTVLHTKINWKRQTPNNFLDVPPQVLGDTTKLRALELFNTVNERYSTNNYLLHKFSEKITATAGMELYYDYAKYTNGFVFKDGQSSLGFTGLAGFAEVNFTSQYANVTLGARYEKYANITPIIVPRLAITKAFEKYHFKALYTEAFKNPTVFNIEFAKNGVGNINPEKFRLIEFEMGWKPRPNFQITANIYDVRISEYITRQDILNNVGQAVGSFVNLGNSGTQGVEAELKWQPKWGTLTAGYSFYRVTDMNENFKLPRISTVLPGVPAQKFTLQGFVKVTSKWTFSPNIIYFNNKFKLSDINQSMTEPQEYAGELHINLYTQYNDFIFKNLSIGLGCFNLLDGNYRILPWKRDVSANITMPWQGREFYVRLLYNLKN